MKQVLAGAAVVSFLVLSRAYGQGFLDADREAVTEVPAAVQEAPAFIVAVTTEFDGTKTFSILSPDEMKTLKQSIAAENVAARKAYAKVKKAWRDKYDIPAPAAPAQAVDTNQVPAGGVFVAAKPKVPQFPIKICPVKGVRQLEACRTEEVANQRKTFYEGREAEQQGKADAANSSKSLGTGNDASFSPSKFKKKDSAPAIDPNVRKEVMKQFADELAKILSGSGDEKNKPGSGNSLGTGTGNTFGGSSLGKK